MLLYRLRKHAAGVDVLGVTFDDFQTWLETAVIALALPVLFTPFGIVALAFGGDGLVVTAGVLLAVNAAGAVLDVRTALLMFSLPPGALVRHDREGREQYYAPEKSG